MSTFSTHPQKDGHPTFPKSKDLANNTLCPILRQSSHFKELHLLNLFTVNWSHLRLHLVATAPSMSNLTNHFVFIVIRQILWQKPSVVLAKRDGDLVLFPWQKRSKRRYSSNKCITYTTTTLCTSSSTRQKSHRTSTTPCLMLSFWHRHVTVQSTIMHPSWPPFESYITINDRRKT